MGQYHLTVNLDKREFVSPHKLGSGLKLWEQLASGNPGKALIILLAQPAHRGGGDFDIDENWHGPERTFPKHNTTPGPMPDEYAAIAARTVGRWRGDRIAIIGDYAADGDIPGVDNVSEIYGLCRESGEKGEGEPYTDVTDDVARVIEHELQGRFIGDGWRNFIEVGGKVYRWEGERPDRNKIEGEITEVKPKLIKVKWPNGEKTYKGENPKVDFF